jgi:hypothetical protein
LHQLRFDQSMLPLPCYTTHEKYLSLKLVKRYQDFVMGRDLDENETSFNIAPMINEMFHNFLESITHKRMDCLRDNFFDYVKGIARETIGLTLPNFLSSNCFHMIISRELQQVQSFIFDLLDNCKAYLKKVLSALTDEFFNQYPKLCSRITILLNESLDTQAEKVRGFLTELIECEMVSEYTTNHYYVDMVNKTTATLNDKKKGRKPKFVDNGYYSY